MKMVSTPFQLFLLSGSGAYRYHWGHLILLTTTSGGVGLDGAIDDGLLPRGHAIASRLSSVVLYALVDGPPE